jgi:hypothetical protein
MRLIRFPLSWLLWVNAFSTMTYAADEAVLGDDFDLLLAQESNEAMNAAGSLQDAQGQPNPGYYEGPNSPNARGSDQDQQRLMQGQGQRPPQGEDPAYQQPSMQGQGTQGQQRPPQVEDPAYQQRLMQGQGTQDQQRLMQGQGTQGQQPATHSQAPDYQERQGTSTPTQGQGVAPAPNMQGQKEQGTTGQPGVGQAQDPLPPDPPQVKLPKKPRVLPAPTPTGAPTFTPAPPPEPIAEPTRPQPSGPKTVEQRSYESAMQTRWKAAADEITLLRSRGESLEGKKGKAFRESLRTASGNRSIARTKLNQLVRASSADFDKFKTGVERAFADLDNSVARVRSYFDEPPPP